MSWRVCCGDAAANDGMSGLPPPNPPDSERDILDDVRDIAHGAIGLSRTSRQSLQDLTDLANADWRLSRGALTRFFLYAVLAAVMLGTAWLLMMALAVYGLMHAGVGWALALALPCLLSFAIAGMLGWMAQDRLMLASMDTTWRQLVLMFKKSKGFEKERTDSAPR